MITVTPWLAYYSPRPQTHLRLFCLPYAGGAASLFRAWGNHLPPTIEVCPIQLPGRENRIGEPAFTQVQPLVQAILNGLQPYLDKPFAFWGHSMGALLAFELARQLRRTHQPAPQHLFVSAHRAPHLPYPTPPIHHLPEAEFMDELRHLQGTPEAVLQHKELMQLLLPLLRCDFELVETYTYHPEAPLPCGISAFLGEQDQHVSPAEMAGWAEQTRGQFHLHQLPGDHFYLHEQRPQLLTLIHQTLHLTG